MTQPFPGAFGDQAIGAPSARAASLTGHAGSLTVHLMRAFTHQASANRNGEPKRRSTSSPKCAWAGQSSFMLKFEHPDHASKQVFDSYNEFLGLLASPEARARLETVTEEESSSDKIFQKARSLSHTFRDGLLTIFFDPQSGLEDLTKNYGVF